MQTNVIRRNIQRSLFACCYLIFPTPSARSFHHCWLLWCSPLIHYQCQLLTKVLRATTWSNIRPIPVYEFVHYGIIQGDILTRGTLSKDDDDGSENVLSNLIASIWTRSVCQMRATFPGVEFLRILFRFKKRKQNSSSHVYVLHKTAN